jgi:hypothetical protein
VKEAVVLLVAAGCPQSANVTGQTLQIIIIHALIRENEHPMFKPRRVNQPDSVFIKMLAQVNTGYPRAAGLAGWGYENSHRINPSLPLVEIMIG